ncbi:MAG: bis(5'-nucleosyl)-tetraphosphatase (symmetrical) YqeK [Firmicutes bacterium]|nr:bis(5'-nucleosyl)-tetraphosphatase (symmetrical) YqeK [Bacillota bacterium]
MKPEESQKLMQKILDGRLYRHCLGVAEAAETLACRFGADPGRAYVAGMVHDYGKRYSFQELINKAAELKLSLDRVTIRECKLLHAPVGAALVELELGITDPGIIKAVASHTTGRPGMTLLEKIIYLADYIEAGRRYEGVEKIRGAAINDLDGALLIAVNHALNSVIARGLLLHPCSVAFRNSLLVDISGR